MSSKQIHSVSSNNIILKANKYYPSTSYKMAVFDNIEGYFQNIRDLNEYSKSLVTLSTSIGAALAIYVVAKVFYHSVQGNFHWLKQQVENTRHQFATN